MSYRELSWRTRAELQLEADRVRVAVAGSAWRRRQLARALADRPDLQAVRRTLAAEQWQEAHAQLARKFTARNSRFPIDSRFRARTVTDIIRRFPSAPADAAARADRIAGGEYDLLGYERLRFARDRSADGTLPDWNYDPVHDRVAPPRFWSTVPYLDASIGDHKIIWELNRHQHWLALGRAYWLTRNAAYRQRAIDELESWMDSNPPLIGINWASMLELGLRALSWIWMLHFFVEADHSDSSPWLVDLLLGLDAQLAHVERNLSYYFSPNTHLLGEALALYVAGRAIPELAASSRREAVGRTILLGEIDRQILPDGGHCERSTHYHRYATDFYAFALIIARLTNDPDAPAFARALERLAFAMRALADDRGELPRWGDDDGGALVPIAGRRVSDARDSLAVAAALLDRPDLQLGSTPEELWWWLNSPVFKKRSTTNGRAAPLPSVALAATGYYVSRTADGTHVVIDGGPHGHLNGGHAHADALALTLTVRGVPLLIDPGAGCYTADTALRDQLRSTPLHNTLTIDGRSQSVPAGPFHWGKTADATVVQWIANDGFDYFDGWHDGYDGTRHRRRVVSLHGDMLVVADYVEGAATRAALHWHVDERWHVELHEDLAVLTTRGDHVRLFVPGLGLARYHGDAASGLGWYSPAYGCVRPTTTLMASREGRAPFWLVTVVDMNAANRAVRVETIPVWADAGAMAHGTAIRVARLKSIDYLLLAEPRQPAASWRVAEFETNARVFFCRTGRDRIVRRLALVDGTFVRTPGARGLHVALPSPAGVHVELSGGARVAGSTLPTRIQVNGCEQPIARERRAFPRV